MCMHTCSAQKVCIKELYDSCHLVARTVSNEELAHTPAFSINDAKQKI